MQVARIHTLFLDLFVDERTVKSYTTTNDVHKFSNPNFYHPSVYCFKCP